MNIGAQDGKKKMILIGTTKSDTFLMLQFEPNESEKKQLAKALECPVKDFEESWLGIIPSRT